MTDDAIGYATAFDIYYRRGWAAVLPVPRGCKRHPPKGYTGNNGRTPSYADMHTWAEEQPDANVALLPPPEVIGIDVDDYDGKNGGATIAEAERRWGKLPYSPRSSARPNDQVSGIRLYRVPPGTRLRDQITFTELGLADVEIVQHHHRYVICWPSIHPSGEQYQWYGVDGSPVTGPPAPAELFELPTTWLHALRAEPASNSAEFGPESPYNVRDAITEGEPAAHVRQRLTDAVSAITNPTGSRHDATRGHVMALLRYGKRGEAGVGVALQTLRQTFVNAVGPDRPGNHAEAIAEFNRMVTNAHAARLLAEPDYEDEDTMNTPDHAEESNNGQHENGSVAAESDDTGQVIHSAHLGMAVKLGKRFKDKLLYIHPLGWHRWDGKRWAPDGNGAARRAVHTLIKHERAQCEKLPVEEREKRAKQIARYETASAISGILTEAAVLEVFSVEVSNVDADPWLFNCANGTLDLQTMELRPHDPADRITRVAKAAYRPDAVGTEWPKFLEEVLPDTSVSDYWQRVVGLSLLGEINGDKQIAPIVTGTGANGKTTAIEAVSFAMGDYATTAEPTLLMAKRSDAHPAGVADLVGRRFVSVSETEQGRRFDIALLKRLTGGETLKARFMRQDFFEFDPSHLLMLSTNHLPRIDDDTEAVWRRVRVIPFSVEIPKAERDTQLKDRLRSEADAVLGWIIAGWRHYRQRGLDEPDQVLIETDKYKSESDAVGRFIDEECHVGGVQSAAKTSVLYARWQTWVNRDGCLPISQIAFGRALDAKGYPADKSGDRLRRRICLRSQEDADQ